MIRKILLVGIVIMGVSMFLNTLTYDQYFTCMKSQEASGVGLTYIGNSCPASVIGYSIGSVAVVIGIIVIVVGAVKKGKKIE